MRIDWCTLEIARVDIGHTRDASTARIWIKIGIEHAVGASELQFGPVAFADLQPRSTEMLAQFIGGHTIQ